MNSLYDILGLPVSVTGVFVVLAIALSLVPYAAGKDFGIIRIPEWERNDHWFFRFCCPILLVLLLTGYLPIWDDIPRCPLKKTEYEVKVTPSSGAHASTNDLLVITLWDCAGRQGQVEFYEIESGIPVVDSTSMFGSIVKIIVKIEDVNTPGIDRTLLKQMEIREIGEGSNNYTIDFPGRNGTSFGQRPRHLNDCLITVEKGVNVFKGCD